MGDLLAPAHSRPPRACLGTSGELWSRGQPYSEKRGRQRSPGSAGPPPPKGLTPISLCQGHTGGSEFGQAERLCGFTVGRGGRWVTCPQFPFLQMRQRHHPDGIWLLFGVEAQSKGCFPKCWRHPIAQWAPVNIMVRTEQRGVYPSANIMVHTEQTRKWELRDITTLSEKPPVGLERGKDGV